MVQLDELGNRALLRVLKYFIRNPRSQISYTNLKKSVKIAKATLTKYLRFLLKENLITMEKIGLNKIYQLNKNNSIVKQFKVLDNLLILNKINLLGNKYGIEIYLYGSSSRGDDVESSDIDLLIIGKIKKEQIFPDLDRISRQIGREIKFISFTPLEWSQFSKKDAAFYERVEKDKIRLC